MNKKAQKVIAGLLYLFMAIIIVALTMPLVRDAIGIGVDSLDNRTNFTNAPLIRMIMLYWPVFFVIMILVIFIIIIRQ